MNLTVIFPRAHADYGSDDVESVMCVEETAEFGRFFPSQILRNFSRPHKKTTRQQQAHHAEEERAQLFETVIF